MEWRDNGLIIHLTCPFVKHNCLRPGRFVYNYQKLNSRNIHIVRSAQEFLHCGEMAFMPSPPGGAPRSELKSNNCQWQLLHNVKVARASPASARRMRALPLPMGEVPLEGAERACLPSQSLCDSSPKVGAKEKRIVTGGNPWKGPHQCEHWLAMTSLVRKVFRP